MGGKSNLYRDLILMSTNTRATFLPTEITQVTKNIYLGGYDNVSSGEFRRYGFAYILNLSQVSYRAEGVKVISLNVEDSPKQNISQYFKRFNALLDHCESNNKKILVHCIAGVNRSGAAVLSYLISKKPEDVDMLIYFLFIYHLLKRKRGAFVENAAFREQIVSYYVA
ncbi:ORF130 [Saltwater crocodilepox virus]|nr:ORF130 [Saltwater crocodilepox virus]QGT47857.1 ORF130 [Saltwater crocodilepox virus]QGT48067.1 ORF130 [Saltwater crocodilepox virus]QGT48281.1 ORF130 [Saltwater crocodilepox virus]QGT48497.1 ORF130 [Saltwater crocodilepox virus]